MSFVVRPVAPEDNGDVFRLLVETGLEVPDDQEAWEAFSNWAYWKNPYRGDRAPGWVGEQDGKLVAYIGCCHMPFRLDGWEGIAGGAGSLAVSPTATGLIGVAFTRSHLNDAATPIQFGAHFNEKSSTLWRGFKGRACGGTNITYIGVLSLVREARAKLKARGPVFSFAARCGADHVIAAGMKLSGRKSLTVGPAHKDIATPISQLSAIPAAALDELCQNAQASLNALVLRSADFLQWRYADHPLSGTYSHLAIFDPQSALLGFAVLQRTRNGQIRLCEFLVRSGEMEAARALLRAVIARTDANGQRRLLAKMGTSNFDGLWSEFGFETETKPYAQYVVSSKGEIALPETMNTMFTYGDFKPS